MLSTSITLFTGEVFAVSQSFSEIAQQYETSLFNNAPELALFWGKSGFAQDRFSDMSLEGYQHWQQQEDGFLSALQALDEKKWESSAEYATFMLLKSDLENRKASRVCRDELWDINPAFGWHNNMAIVASIQPVGTDEYRQQAMKRWKTFENLIAQQLTNLKTGVRLGYIAPKAAVKGVIEQVRMMSEVPIEQSPFFDFARRDDDGKFKSDVSNLIKTSINPALKQYADYLEKDYLPIARDEIGVSNIPSGNACYQAKIQEMTTLNMSPEEIHQRGLKAIEKLSEEVAAIGLKKYGISDMSEVYKRATEETVGYFTSEQDILDYNQAALEKAQAKVTDWFDLMPKIPGVIRPYPAHRAKTGASGEYHPPDDMGERPGIFFINTWEPQKHSRIDQEATLFHELIPGHHFQFAVIYESKEIPTINRYLIISGFVEGWALYAERLADEMGLYTDDISRLGMLANESLRAARLVVDTGIHAFGWSREKAVAYLKSHSTLSDYIIEGEVDRYIMMPAQATAYLLGKDEIERLRQQAKDSLGDAFDIRQFHNQVLKNGTVTLPVLRWQIEEWLKN